MAWFVGMDAFVEPVERAANDEHADTMEKGAMVSGGGGGSNIGKIMKQKSPKSTLLADNTR